MIRSHYSFTVHLVLCRDESFTTFISVSLNLVRPVFDPMSWCNISTRMLFVIHILQEIVEIAVTYE